MAALEHRIGVYVGGSFSQDAIVPCSEARDDVLARGPGDGILGASGILPQHLVTHLYMALHEI